MELRDLQVKYKQAILDIARENKADNVRVFGSVARHEADPNDIDFLVHLKDGASLVDLSGLILDLRELLQCKVDVVPDNSIHRLLRDRILKEAVKL